MLDNYFVEVSYFMKVLSDYQESFFEVVQHSTN